MNQYNDYSFKFIKNLTLRLILYLNKYIRNSKKHDLIVFSGDLIEREIVINGTFEALELEVINYLLDMKFRLSILKVSSQSSIHLLWPYTRVKNISINS